MNDTTNKEKQNNIQVAVRVRPLIARESGHEELWEVKDSKTICRKHSATEKFYYDRVFGGTESNLDVYNGLCRPILKKVVEGFNATIFAYGQTASGKSFTMLGEHNGIKKGVIHYAISEIFEMIQNMPEREFLLRVSVVEIYNEKVYDLLSEKDDDLKLMDDCYGVLKVNGLEERIVQTSDQIWNLMYEGQTKRRTGETQMNRVSSRSHFIFRMILESSLKDEEDPIVNVSQLNFVDLAGSENVKQTKTKGVRFKEGVIINLSLSTLSHVISQLSERPDQFINYRSSKLTRLLQNSVGGNAHTAIICTVTPTSLNETLSTLKFASTAKKIKNKPEKNEILTDQALLKQYANKIKKLSEELKTTKEQGEIELKEKKEQNETLKKQIETLKANFVGNPENKIKVVRRETWGGRLDRKKFLDPIIPYYQLPNIYEEESEGESEILAIMETVKSRSSRGTSSLSMSSFSSACMLNNNCKDIGIQTNELFEESADIDELMTMVSDLKSQLTSLQTEFAEHLEYTTYEKQILKAENELQVENEALKAENTILRRKLESKSLLEKSHLTSFNESKILEYSLSKSDFLECKNFSTDQYTQITPIKLNEFGTQYCRNEFTNEYSVQTSPIQDIKPFSGYNFEKTLKVDQNSQVTPVKSKEFSAQYCGSKITNEHSIQTSPINDFKSISGHNFQDSLKIDQHSQVTPVKSKEFSAQYCGSKITNEHSIQTSPINDFKSIYGHNFQDSLKIDQHSQVTDSFVEETDITAKRNKSCEMFHQSSQTSASFAKDTDKSRDLQKNEIFICNSFNTSKEAEICECGYFSDEIKILVKKVTDLRQYARGILKQCLKVEYLRDADKYLSDANDSCLNSAIEEVTDLENLMSFFGYYISNVDQDCESITNQLESRFQEINSLDSELFKVKEALNLKESELSSLNNLIFDLKQNLLKLTSICEVLNVGTLKNFTEIKEGTSMSDTSQSYKLEHEMTVFKNYFIKLDSYIEETSSKYSNLSENFKIVQSELEAVQRKEQKLFENTCKNTATKSIQTLTEQHATDVNGKDLEILRLKNEKDTLIEQIHYLEEKNKDLKKEIDDLCNFEKVEAIENELKNVYKIKTEMLIKDLEEKYDKELIDQENKFANELFVKVQEVKQQNSEQLQKLKAEIEEVKLFHSRELSDLARQHEDQLAVLHSEKESLKHQLERENAKIISIKEKYGSKHREFKNINSQLKVKLQHYIEEIEILKNKNIPSNHLQVIEKLKEKMREISDERDNFRKMYSNADLQISDLKKHNNHLKHELKKISEDESKQDIHDKICTLEKTNKELLYELDQKKAKIITLQSNNASMLQELKKLKEMQSSKSSAACKCKTNSRESNSDIHEKNEDKKNKKNKMDCRNDLDGQEKATPMQRLNDENSTPRQEDDDFNNKTPSQNVILCVGGGSGPANMVKTYWLEGIIHKKDKEIDKKNKEIQELKDKLGDLNFELKSKKIQPVINEEKQSESIKAEVKKPEIMKKPVISPLHEIDENVTAQVNTFHPYPQGAVPKVSRKHASREKNGGITTCKPYDKHKNLDRIKKENIASNWQNPGDSDVNNHVPQTESEVLKQLTDPDNCKQQ